MYLGEHLEGSALYDPIVPSESSIHADNRFASIVRDWREMCPLSVNQVEGALAGIRTPLDTAR
jgi:hypothetical protein